MYLPVYLAEFADNLADESRRVTCLAFANQASPVSIHNSPSLSPSSTISFLVTKSDSKCLILL